MTVAHIYAVALAILVALPVVSQRGKVDAQQFSNSLGQSEAQLQRGLEFSRQGKASEAEALVRQGLKTRQQLLEPNDLKVGAAMEIVGRVYFNNGDYLQSEQYFRNSLAIYSEIAGPTSLEASFELGNIAAALREQRRYRAAEELSLNSLELRRAAVPSDSPYLAGGLDNLGRTYLATGRYLSAQQMFEKSRDLMARYVDSDDPAIRRERAMLAIAVAKQDALIQGNTILLLSPVLVALLALISEIPAIAGIVLLKRIVDFVTIVAAYAFKGFAIYFGAFVLMPLLMWVLPTPLNATQIKPVAMLIGGASGLGAITAFIALLNWARAAIAQYFFRKS